MTLSTAPVPENITEDQHQTGTSGALNLSYKDAAQVHLYQSGCKTSFPERFPALHSCRRLCAMSAPIVCRVLAITFLLSPFLAAQQSASAPSSTTTCNLDDGRQVYIRYNPVSPGKEKVSNGKAWTPGGAAMTLFTEAQLTLGSSMIPVGAYSVYPIPGK